MIINVKTETGEDILITHPKPFSDESKEILKNEITDKID